MYIHIRMFLFHEVCFMNNGACSFCEIWEQIMDALYTVLIVGV